MEQRDHFADRADGAIGTANSGQTYLYYPTSGAGEPIISGGKYTITSSGPMGSYASVLLDESTRRVGARFTFSSYSTTSGSAVLCAWAADIGPLLANSDPVPDAPIHLAIGPESWTYGVWSGGSFSTVASGYFTPALPHDGSTVLSAEVVLDKENARAFVRLPDGSLHVVEDALLGSVTAPYACWEVFRYVGGGTDTLAAFVDTWADSHEADKIVRDEWANTVPHRITGGDCAPSTAASVAITTTEQDMHADLTATFTAPASGDVWVTLSGCLAMTSSTRVFFTVREGATTYATLNVVSDQRNGQATVRKKIHFTPGTDHTVTFGAWALANSIATFLLDGPNGYAGSITVEPA